LLDRYEPGMTVARLEPILSEVSRRLVPVVRAIASRSPEPVQLWEKQAFPVDAQWDFSFVLLKAMGFDLNAGRQDRSVHPFTSASDATDVRLTTRLDERQPLSGIFTTLHEGGHGLYEQGFEPALSRTPLAQGASMGLHESQSRLWENQVGRSRAFWTHFLPKLQAHFPTQLQGVSVDDFYRSSNRVRCSLIRTESDELTYNLHIILRFELERSMLRGDLAVKDVPQAWSDRVHAFFGVRPANDVEGPLQDIHWSSAEFGYFPTYTLGNLYAASLFAAAGRKMPHLLDDISRGELSPLRAFLKEHVHRHGSRTTAEERVRQVTGSGLTPDDFFDYLKDKYEPLYPGSFREQSG
jgi:carboxypeptidase Taq